MSSATRTKRASARLGVSRRGLLLGAAAWTVAATLPTPSRAQARVGVTDLAEGVALFGGAGANVVAVRLGDALLAIDGGGVGHSDALLGAIATRFEGARPGVLINTNWRPEHTGLNDPLGAEGARIIAHEYTKLWMGNDFRVAWEDTAFTRRAPQALPNETYYTSTVIDVGGEDVELIYLPQAHTDGDLCVRLPRHDVLVVSDLLAVGSYPVFDYATGGWIGGMIAANERLFEIAGPDTLVVPALGRPVRRAAIVEQLELCRAVQEALRQAYTSALSVEEFLATRPADAYVPERGDPGLFLRLAYKSVWGHIRDLGWSIV